MKWFVFLSFVPFLTNQELVLTTSNSLHNLSCPKNFYIKIYSINYFYHQYNCTWIFNPTAQLNQCFNQTSCTVNLKSFFSTHFHSPMHICRKIKFKSIQVNYTCLNETSTNDMLIQAKTISMILCLSLMIFVSLFAFVCSYFQQNLIINQQEYELKHVVPIKTSSSSLSTLTSLNNKNLLTTTSEYDNLMKNL